MKNTKLKYYLGTIMISLALGGAIGFGFIYGLLLAWSIPIESHPAEFIAITLLIFSILLFGGNKLAYGKWLCEK